MEGIGIGSIRLKSSVISAPLAGISNHPFRVLMKSLGAGLVFTEMVSSEGIIRNNRKSFDLLYFKDYERPIGIQLFGNCPEHIAEAAEIVEEKLSPDIIDINLGCSVKKVVRNGAGAALLKDTGKIARLLKKVREKIRTPLTIKIRAGWDENSINYLEVGRIAEDNGVDAVTFHARTAKDQFKNKSEWNWIKNLQENIKIPVIGNGDITDYETAKKKLNFFYIKYIMLGRVLFFQPWIIKEINENKKIDISFTEKKEFIKLHLKKLVEYMGNKQGTRMFRKHFSWYTKGMRYSANLRKTAFTINDYEEMLALIDRLSG